MKKKQIKLIFLISVGVYFLAFLWSARSPIKEFHLSAFVYKAVDAGDITQVKVLLSRGANINREGAGGLAGGTPLVWAISNSDITMIQFLVHSGADVNQKLSGGSTPIMYAKEPKIIQILVDLGAKTNK